MSRLPVRQSVAERWTRVAFACALAAAVGTATIFMLPPPKAPELTGLAGTPMETPARKPPRAPSAGVSTDWPGITASVQGLRSPLIQLWLEEEAARKAALAAQTPDGEPATPFTSGGFAPPWRYLGSISDGVQRLALVVINGRQRFVREGFRSEEGYRVVTIDPERLVIEQGSARHEVLLEASARPGGLSGAASATPRTAPPRFERLPGQATTGGVRTASGDESERRLLEGEPLSVERARQGLRGTPVPSGGGGGA